MIDKSNQEIEVLNELLADSDISPEICLEVLKLLGMPELTKEDFPDFLSELKLRIKSITPKSVIKQKRDKAHIKGRITVVQADLERYKLLEKDKKNNYIDAKRNGESHDKLRKLEIICNRVHLLVEKTENELTKLLGVLSTSQTNAGEE